jgi:hypothetical protein
MAREPVKVGSISAPDPLNLALNPLETLVEMRIVSRCERFLSLRFFVIVPPSYFAQCLKSSSVVHNV